MQLLSPFDRSPEYLNNLPYHPERSELWLKPSHFVFRALLDAWIISGQTRFEPRALDSRFSALFLFIYLFF